MRREASGWGVAAVAWRVATGVTAVARRGVTAVARRVATGARWLGVTGVTGVTGARWLGVTGVTGVTQRAWEELSAGCPPGTASEVGPSDPSRVEAPRWRGPTVRRRLVRATRCDPAAAMGDRGPLPRCPLPSRRRRGSIPEPQRARTTAPGDGSRLLRRARGRWVPVLRLRRSADAPAPGGLGRWDRARSPVDGEGSRAVSATSPQSEQQPPAGLRQGRCRSSR